MADETGLDFTDQINLLESKYQEVSIHLSVLHHLYFCVTKILIVSIMMCIVSLMMCKHDLIFICRQISLQNANVAHI